MNLMPPDVFEIINNPQYYPLINMGITVKPVKPFNSQVDKMLYQSTYLLFGDQGDTVADRTTIFKGDIQTTEDTKKSVMYFVELVACRRPLVVHIVNAFGHHNYPILNYYGHCQKFYDNPYLVDRMWGHANNE
jgi:hypothetical protein